MDTATISRGTRTPGVLAAIREALRLLPGRRRRGDPRGHLLRVRGPEDNRRRSSESNPNLMPCVRSSSRWREVAAGQNFVGMQC